jgi:diguanylate cyclase (GGDEF)-like protein
VLDGFTGHEAIFSPFYMLPVGLLAWYGSGPGCYLLAALAAASGQLANGLAGEVYSHILFAVWNDLMGFADFAVLAYLLRLIRLRYREELERSRLDYLTGLPNRRAFLEVLEAEWSRLGRGGQPLAVGFIDLDRFKEVNDEFGHAEGDRLLQAVASTMRQSLRRSDHLARVGGDEFALLLGNCSAKQAETVAIKLLEAISALAAGQGWPISASIGLVVAHAAPAGRRYEEVLEAADAAMYRAKASGRRTYEVQSWPASALFWAPPSIEARRSFEQKATALTPPAVQRGPGRTVAVLDKSS